MERYDYLIVGGGMAADAAVRGIREIDSNRPIGLIGAESEPPYNRPPLSKGLWKGKPEASIWRGTEEMGVELHLGRSIVHLDPAAHEVIDAEGRRWGYRRLLLATGGSPRHLPFGEGEIIYFRTLADYRRLRELSERGERFAVIGGGFIGSEIAAALAMNGKQVTLIFPGPAIGAQVFPPDLASALNDYYRAKGVEVLSGWAPHSFEVRGGEHLLGLLDRNGEQQMLSVDGTVAGIGIVPNVALARDSGIDVDNGIRVDASLRTSLPDIFAAGDVATYFSPYLGRRVRVEHEDNANTMGRAAGRAMAGDTIDYGHLSYFYSDLFELGYEAVGELDPRLEMVADWREPFREGVVYYLEQGRVRGVLLWNVWGQVEAARQLIAEPPVANAEELLGRIRA